MIRDLASELSTDQSIADDAGTIVSTNYLDTQAPGGDIAVGTPVEFSFEITEAVTSAGAATVTFQLFTDDSSAFGSEVKVYDSGAIGKAELTKGKRIDVKLPYGMKRYLRAKYVIGTATTTAGKVTGGIVKASAHWKAANPVGVSY